MANSTKHTPVTRPMVDFWTAAKIIHVWSPLVPKPVARSLCLGKQPDGQPQGQGHQEMPIPEFRTDSWDLPESEDLTDKGLTREFSKQWKTTEKPASNTAAPRKPSARSKSSNASKPSANPGIHSLIACDGDSRLEDTRHKTQDEEGFARSLGCGAHRDAATSPVVAQADSDPEGVHSISRGVP
jgi:hypothetical protein